MIKRYLLEELLAMIDDPAGASCLRITRDNEVLFKTVQGSTHNHQNWPGGYYDHVTEVLNIAVALYAVMDGLRPLPFSLSDALLILFLHDIEKPWKYEPALEGGIQEIPALRDKEAQHVFRAKKLLEYGIALTEDQANALRYVEGESKDYSSKRRVMGPLAAFCHMCDVASARIWFDYPSPKNDPWPGARRVAG